MSIQRAGLAKQSHTLQPAAPPESQKPPVASNHRAHFPEWGISVDTTPPAKRLSSAGATPDYFTEPLQNNRLIDTYALDNYKPIVTPTAYTGTLVKAQIKKKFGLDVDPNKTYLVTIAYNRDKKPYEGVIVQKISLADAARLNIQSTSLPGLPQKYRDPKEASSLSINIQPNSRHTERPGVDGTFPTPLVGQFNTQYQAIYTEPSADSPTTFGPDNQLPIDPKEFKQMSWDHAYKKPYDDYLNFYWSHNNTRHAYAQLSKVSYLKAAHTQHHEQSLDEAGRKIAMRLTGIPADQTYLDAGGFTLETPYVRDPNLETKLLTFNGFKSTSIFYTRDTQTQKTLLYIPGNASPIHSFDSPEAMNKWLGSQLTDEHKVEAFKTYFSLSDLDSSLFFRGLNDRIHFLHNHLKEPGAVDYYERRGYWKEGGVFSGDTVEGDPFKEMQVRTESEMKRTTGEQFVLNSDHTKKTILKANRWLSTALLFLTPLGMALPPVGLLLTGLSVGTGVVELGVGIDDKVHGRPGGSDRILFGAFNALKPVFTAGLGNGLPPLKPLIQKIV
ncbi:dermonecrotic toxin domain-containing protein [Pseudomonas reactans]|uniref:dermonecrotic toxin domain-containing protein n=1 Tax=Pseudomonas reactans TaxID=117680 RepID=UPI0015A23DC7|nr:DUF6543 domain-containing protein [Pseudomonas reactans]NWA69954.1 hypothetical protein [Pseudomonas reactans]